MSSNPVEDFFTELEEQEKTASISRQKKDFAHWNTWQQGGKKSKDMEGLLKQMDPLIRRASNVYAGKVNIPKSAIRAEFQIQAMKAFDKYDPKRGAALGTFLTWQLKKGKRFVSTYQNIGRIPETRIHHITTFKNARDDLSDKLGREPSGHELSDQLKWPISQVSAMEAEQRKEVLTSTLQADMTSLKPSKTGEVLRLVQYDLKPEEKLVYEYLLGVNGKPQLKPGQIAGKLKMAPSKVSRIKLSVAQKVKRYY